MIAGLQGGSHRAARQPTLLAAAARVRAPGREYRV